VPDPVQARVLKFFWKAVLYLITLDFASKGAWGMQTADISPELLGHEPHAAIDYGAMSLLLLYPELLCATSLVIEKKVSK
jgi:hypothetical protein